VIDQPLAEALSAAASLTPFGVEYRYPGEYPPVSGDEAAQSIEIARSVFRTVAARLKADAPSQ
jgi:hypothetical protein